MSDPVANAIEILNGAHGAVDQAAGIMQEAVAASTAAILGALDGIDPAIYERCQGAFFGSLPPAQTAIEEMWSATRMQLMREIERLQDALSG